MSSVEEEMALTFAAKQENEELRENLKLLKSSVEVSKINIESLVSSARQKDDYIRVLDNEILDKDIENKELKSKLKTIVHFLEMMNETSHFLGWRYRSCIKEYLKDYHHLPEK